MRLSWARKWFVTGVAAILGAYDWSIWCDFAVATGAPEWAVRKVAWGAANAVALAPLPLAVPLVPSRQPQPPVAPTATDPRHEYAAPSGLEMRL